MHAFSDDERCAVTGEKVKDLVAGSIREEWHPPILGHLPPGVPQAISLQDVLEKVGPHPEAAPLPWFFGRLATLGR